MRKKLGIAVVCSISLMSAALIGTTAMAREERIAVRYDEQEAAWDELAMTNDDEVETGINIRGTADTEGEILGFLYPGTAVWVLNHGEEWTEIYSGGITGYVNSKFLIFGDDARGFAEKHGVEGITAIWDDVSVYAEPDGHSEVVKVLNTGDDMVLLEDNGHWLTVLIETEQPEVSAEEAAEPESEGAEAEEKEQVKAYVSADDVKKALLLDAAIPKDGIYREPETSEEPETESAETEYIETEAPQTEAPQTEAPQTETPQTNPPQTEAPQTETPQTNPPQTEAPQTETPQTNPPQTEAPQTEAPQTEPPQTDAPQTEAPAEDPNDGDDIYYEDEDGDSDADVDASDDGWYDADTDTYYDADGNVISQGSSSDSDGEDVYEEEYIEEVDEASDANAYEEEYYEENTYAEDNTADTYEEEVYGDDTYTEDSAETYVEETEAAPAASESDTDLLAALIYCEAGNQSYEGQVAVGAVVMNRLENDSFGGSISDVIYESGQFTPASSGALDSALANGVPESCYEAANEALSGSDPTGGALYFNAGSGQGTQIGDHQFY